MSLKSFATTWLATAAALLLPTVASAQEAPYTAEYTTCIEQSAGVTATTLDCISAETERQNTALQQAEQALRAALPRSNQTALAEAQRDWRRYRQSTCNLQQRVGDGSAATLAAASCRLDLLVQRVALIKQWQAEVADSK